jgi:non-heme chloroperoxidase
MRVGYSILTLLLCLSIAAGTQAPPGWRDPSPHKVQFVTVEPGVQLEVLDWGGSGRPLVMLAGAGCTAHIYDELAPALTAWGHIYGITRRGAGASGRPGKVRDYKEERLAQDVIEVIRALHLKTPVLIGHSMAGGEMALVADQYSDALSGLIFLDAAGDPKDWPGNDAAYMALYNQLPEGARREPEATDSDRRSFQSYSAWARRAGKVVFPESELRNTRETNPDGSIGNYTITPGAWDAMGKGAVKRDYSKITVPILALFPGPAKQRKYEPINATERAAFDAFDAATLAYVNRWKKNLQTAPGGLHIVDIPGADHYIFLSNPAEVLRETEAFLKQLH